MNLNQRPVECVKLYADSLRKTIRLLTNMRFLIDHSTLAIAAAKQIKGDEISKLIEVLGAERTGVILLELQGRAIHFPRRSGLLRIVKSEYIKKELRPLKRGSHEFQKKVRQLSELLEMSRPSVRRTFTARKYCE